MRVVLVISFLFGACTGGAPSPSSQTAPPAPPPAAPPTGVLHAAVPGVYAKACATECADELAELVTYRDPAGAIAIVTVQGSPQGCSHPPLRFLGPDGAERAVIPMQPVVAGSDDSRRFDAIRAAQLEGLSQAETMQCRDVKH